MERKIQIADKPTLDAVANNTENILEKIGNRGGRRLYYARIWIC